MSKKPRHSKPPARKRPERRLALGGPIWEDLAELREARALWVKEDLVGALVLFDRTARSHPRHVRALVDASRTLGALYQYPRAEELIGQLIALGERDGQVLHLAAQSYRLIRRPRQAVEFFERALASKNATPDSHLELALLYERQNQLEKALAHANARSEQVPGDAEATFLRGRLLRRTKHYEGAESILRTVADNRSVQWMTRSRACAELAQLRDELASYEQAWEAMLAGKRIIAAHAKTAREHRERLVPPLAKLAREVTPQHFTRWRSAANNECDAPRFALLTGLPRSGTTLLERILDAHADVVACDEFDLFPRIMYPLLLGGATPAQGTAEFFDRLPNDKLAKLLHDYAQGLTAAVARPTEGRVLLDKHPSLLPLLTPYLRMAPFSRVIVALRDPRDVLVSCLLAYLPLNDFSVDLLSLETAAERLASDLECWFDLREKLPSNWIELRYEDTVNDLSGVARRALSHLGVPWNDAVVDYRAATADRIVNSPSYDAVSQPLYRTAIGRWRNYTSQLHPVLPRLAPLVLRLGYDRE